MEINENEIHIWIIDANETSVYGNYEDYLNDNERLRVKNFLTENLKKNHIVSHFATRDILSHYLNIPPIQIPIIYSEHHKPYLQENPTQVQFNLSHSHGVSLLGITKTYEIGMDIEKIEIIENQRDIEKMILTQNECNWLSSRSCSRNCESFYRLWTAKEAVLKGIGDGFHFGIENVEFQMPLNLSDRINVQIHSHPEESLQWTVQNLPFLDKYMGAYATKQPIHSVSQFNWEGQISLSND